MAILTEVTPRWADGTFSAPPPVVPGGTRYYSSPGATSTAALTNGDARPMMFHVPPGGARYDRIACESTGAGDATAVIRFGIYTLDANGLPNVLLLDAGAVAANVTGIVQATINQTLAAGLYGLLAVSQVAVTPASVRTIAQAGAGWESAMLGIVAANLPGGVYGLQQTGLTGALPASSTFDTLGGSYAAKVWLRAA